MKKIIKLLALTFSAFAFVSCNNYQAQHFEDFFKKVVEIKVINQNNEIISYASGTIINNQIMTNKHVYIGKEYKYFYRENNSEEFIETFLKQTSLNYDLASFTYNKINKGFNLKIENHIGTKVYTIGNPQGYGLGLVEGIISTINFFSENKKQIEYMRVGGSIDQGNSGGPVFDASGNLLGIVSFKILNEKGSKINSFFYAVPAKHIEEFLQNQK